ncbi:hypothetical protein BXO88_15020 [Oribacterium sp. C9]|uniref:type II secretion system protein n=1 Tax=Oribacterium sp. C9 TaxID=1943579 RepID=UPI00098FA1FC|nr:type II secretion system protein [Oribacterium sp. C9]OON84885.1 hypothetical protein BXO88_15020 [Oribacterium sp. C9]
MKNRLKKGFTLLELLIVMAIVGVLVAISIPYFNAELEKTRETHDLAIMRQAAYAAIDLYYQGIYDETSAGKAGMSWNTGGGKNGTNAFGAYDPKTGKFYKTRDLLPETSKKYGKGTKIDAGTTYASENANGAYAPKEDYTNAVVLVSIYPLATQPHVDVYWKNNVGPDKNNYVGGKSEVNVPKYSMRVNIN